MAATINVPLLGANGSYTGTVTNPSSLEGQKKVILGLITAAFKAMELFQLGRYEQFDALVGENACQVRAAMVLELTEAALDMEADRAQLLAVAGRVDQLAYSANLKGRVEETFPQNSLPMVSPMVAMLTGSYLLTKYRVDRPRKGFYIPQEIDVKKLAADFSCSNSVAARVVKAAQRTLASTSCDFLRERALALEDPTLDRLTDAPYRVTTERKQTESLPCLVSLKVILPLLKRQGTPITLVAVQRDAEFNEVSRVSRTFPAAAEQEQPTFVVEGLSVAGLNRGEIEEAFAAMDDEALTELLEANAVCHGAYPGDAINPPQALEGIEDEVERLAITGLDKGYSRENPTTFVIEHIFASTVGAATAAPTSSSTVTTTGGQGGIGP